MRYSGTRSNMHYYVQQQTGCTAPQNRTEVSTRYTDTQLPFRTALTLRYGCDKLNAYCSKDNNMLITQPCFHVELVVNPGSVPVACTDTCMGV